ncbi:Hypothetical predicted protein [Octopus vulgaris]|uniref:Uncharacterized protein n=2 Tax=Octopus vulgaris TaxID=6645 RepID=A0AA36B3K5_OCTVU|nr:Hypothetical predicted protein [Octopus vulgaris]
MKYSPEFAVLQSTFKLFEKFIKESNKDLSSLSKKCCQQFSPVLVDTINEVCNGLMADNDSGFTKEHWRFTLHLVIFLKLIAHKQLEEESLWNQLREENVCKDTDLLAIAQTVLPHISPVVYFELVTSCNWEGYYMRNLILLDEADVHSLIRKMLQYCLEEPQSLKDIPLLSSVTMMVVRTCLPEVILDVSQPLIKRKFATSCFLQSLKLKSFIDVMNANPNLLNEILQCLKELLLLSTCHSTESKPNPGIADASQTDGLFFHLTCLWVAFCSTHYDIHIKLIDLMNDMAVQEVREMAYPDVAQNVSQYLQKENDLESLMEMDSSVNEFFQKIPSLFEFNSCISTAPDPRLLIENIYLYLKWRADLENPKPLQDFDIFSVDKCSDVFHSLLPKLICTNTLEEESPELLRHVEFISQYFGQNKHSLSSSDNKQFLNLDPPSVERNPSDVFLEMFANRKIDDWKDKRFFEYINTHKNLLSQKKQLLSLWEGICWLASLNEERTVTEKYLQVLLNAFASLPSFLQDDIICQTYLAVDQEENRPWWRRMSNFRQPFTMELNKLTEIRDIKIPYKISQYALLDIESIIKISVATALRNPKQMDVIVKMLQLLPNSCKSKKRYTTIEDEDLLSESLLGSQLFEITSSEPMDEKQQNTFIKLLQQLLTPFSIGVCQKYGIKQILLQTTEILRIYILPHLHLLTSTDCHLHNPVLLLHLASVVFSCEESQIKSCLDNIQLHVVLLQFCYALNDCTEFWEDVNQAKQLVNMKALLISLIDQVVEILINNYTLVQGNIVLWLKEEIKSLDWTVKFRLRKLLCINENDVNQSICCQFLKTQNLLHDCDLSQTLNLLRFVSIDEEFCQEMSEHFPSNLHLSRDHVCLALAQLIPNLLSSECILVCQFLKHLLHQKQLVVPCQANFLPVVPFFDITGLQEYSGLCQILIDSAVLQGPLDANSSRHVLNNILAVIRKLILSENVLNQTTNVLFAILVISQTFSNLVLILKFLPWFNSETVLLYLVETTSFLNSYASLYFDQTLKLESGGIHFQTKTNNLENLKTSGNKEDLQEISMNLISVNDSKISASFVCHLLDSMFDLLTVLKESQIKESLSRNIKNIQEKYEIFW